MPMPKPTTKIEGLPLSIIILFPIDSSLGGPKIETGGQRLSVNRRMALTQSELRFRPRASPEYLRSSTCLLPARGVLSRSLHRLRHRCRESRPNYGFVLAPRPNIFEAQLAFCQLVEFSPDLYTDCVIAAANPDRTTVSSSRLARISSKLNLPSASSWSSLPISTPTASSLPRIQTELRFRPRASPEYLRSSTCLLPARGV